MAPCKPSILPARLEKRGLAEPVTPWVQQPEHGEDGQGMDHHLLKIIARELSLLKRKGAFWSLTKATCSFQEMYIYTLSCKPSQAAGSLADNDEITGLC